MTSCSGGNPAGQGLLGDDLEYIYTGARVPWRNLDGANLFITGGTGFVGCWLLETLVWLIDRLHLNTNVHVLTRDPHAFERKAPHLAAHPALRFHIGDVRSFEFPPGGFSIVIHAAAPSASNLEQTHPELMFDIVVEGTRRTLEFARHCGAHDVLFLSSGAVYGGRLRPREDDFRGNEGPPTGYAQGKLNAEGLCQDYANRYGLAVKVARCFTFIGPYLPLDAHFAIGNFIRDGLAGGPIVVTGDGTPQRSYLYAADLMVWLWTILLAGRSGRAYNVGSERSIAIRDLARLVADSFGTGVEVRRRAEIESKCNDYVPCTERAVTELGLRQRIGLGAAIRKTIEFNRKLPARTETAAQAAAETAG